MTTYKPGSFFLVNVTGPAGFLIGVGQALAGEPSRYEHAGIVLDQEGTTVEAAPGGAFYGHLSAYEGRALLVSDAPVQMAVRNGADEHATRLEVTYQAHQFIGIDYSALDYVALALLHLHLPSRRVRQRVQRSGHVICSQLVDAVMERAGIHLFTDGRLPGDVMPADLAAWAEDHQ